MQFEKVEDLRRVEPGHAATLIPSWNTGFALRTGPWEGAATGEVMRPGQKLQVLGTERKHVRVRLESSGAEGWLPEHVVAPWPE